MPAAAAAAATIRCQYCRSDAFLVTPAVVLSKWPDLELFRGAIYECSSAALAHAGACAHRYFVHVQLA